MWTEVPNTSPTAHKIRGKSLNHWMIGALNLIAQEYLTCDRLQYQREIVSCQFT